MTIKMSSFEVDTAPVDPLFHLSARYKADRFEKKVDLGIGAYRDDNGKPWILPAVKKAERLLFEDPDANHEYLPIAGNAEFCDAAAKLIFGKGGMDLSRISSVQTLSGTGANHLGAAFLKKYPPNGNTSGTIYVPDPTWANHHNIYNHAGLVIKKYPYFDPTTRGLNITGLLDTLSQAVPGDVVLLHACAHNPTGVDPTREQWIKISEVVQSRKLFPFFDSAYQGFASGDLDNDAWAIRYFANLGLEMLVCQSFSKNMGLYGERAGVLHFLATPESQDAVLSQLKKIERAEISNPPAYGSRIAARIVGDDVLFEEWKRDLQTMAYRIKDMRHALRSRLVEYGTPGTWDHIVDQIGMFSYTGLTATQVERLVNEFHIYLVSNGRISMAGLNSNNINYVAKAIDTVVRETNGHAVNGIKA
jgi:aspartate aminotransferase